MKNIRYGTFSQDSQWLVTTDDYDNSKVWSVETGKYYDFLKDEKIFATLLFLLIVNGSSQEMIMIIQSLVGRNRKISRLFKR
jgi:hypothetical protein